MKSFVKFLSVALVALPLLVSCHMDNVDYEGIDGPAKNNVGYLQVGNMQASVIVDTENFDSAEATRAGEVDINTFDVVILDVNGNTVKSFKYGERPKEAIALEGGVYTIKMSSATMQNAAWEAPVYAGEKEVVITRKQTTTVSELVCKLANIKVTVDYSADIKDQLDPEYTTMNVELEDSALLYVFNEARAGYFAPVAVDNTLKLTFNCRYKGETKNIIMTNEIKGVKAAQWRKINVVVQHAADGTATIGIKCDTWTYDEEITFDTSVSLMEEVIPDDTDAPVIVWEGHDLAETFELTDLMFDADGNFTSSINIDVTSKAALKSLVIKASSDNAEFTKAYADVVPLEVDLCSTTVSSTLLKMMGYPSDAKGATSTRLKFAAQTELFRSHEGTHSFEITATDENGAHSTATLAIKYGQNVAPQIIWVGYDIDKRQTYTAGMTCDLTIKAPLTIADFTVKIISETLNASQLEAVGLASEFSLVKDEQYFIALGGDPNATDEEKREGLGFPVGDEVLGQTELNLSITKFLGVLAVLGPGDHDFEMSVTDAEGNVTTKTVMFRFN